MVETFELMQAFAVIWSAAQSMASAIKRLLVRREQPASKNPTEVSVRSEQLKELDRRLERQQNDLNELTGALSGIKAIMVRSLPKEDLLKPFRVGEVQVDLSDDAQTYENQLELLLDKLKESTKATPRILQLISEASPALRNIVIDDLVAYVATVAELICGPKHFLQAFENFESTLREGATLFERIRRSIRDELPAKTFGTGAGA